MTHPTCERCRRPVADMAYICDTCAGYTADENRRLAAVLDEARAERDAALPVVEAAKALVADWQAHRATHGGGLIAAVDQYEASDLGPPHAGVAGEEVDHGDDSPR